MGYYSEVAICMAFEERTSSVSSKKNINVMN